MSDHTPGPWGYTGRSETGHVDSIYIYSKNPECKRQTCVGEVYMDDAEPQSTEANARLIAAAPEMKDLLWDAWQDLNALSNGDQSCDARYEATKKMEKIMSLLRRIEGKEETE